MWTAAAALAAAGLVWAWVGGARLAWLLGLTDNEDDDA